MIVSPRSGAISARGAQLFAVLASLFLFLTFGVSFLPSTLGDAFAQTVDTTLFGPQHYQRSTGQPVTVTNTFVLPSSVGASAHLHIDNGNAGANRVTSATVVLNGVEVVGPNDFNKNVASIDRSVTLNNGNNTIAVTLAGAPASVFTLTITGTRIPPAPTSLSPNPLTITAGASGNLTATLSPAPNGPGTLSIASANSGIASVPASVAFAANQTAVPIPVNALAAGITTVSASANGTTASATINVTPTPPTISSLTPGSLNITQGANGTLTVTLSAVQTTNTPVWLTSDNAHIAVVSSSVTVIAGQLSASIPVSAWSPGSTQITATLNGSSASSHVTVTAIPPTVSSLLPATSTVTQGASTNFTLTISAAQSVATVVPLTVAPTGIITAPASITIPAGQASVAVPVTGVAFGQAGITANLNGSTAAATVNVVPPAPQIVSLAPAALTMTVGATSQFTVTINAAQPSNTDITLTTDKPQALQVPATVTIAQGATSAVFTVTSLATDDAVLIATTNGTQKTASVHIAPQPAAIASLLPNPLPLQQGATGSLTVAINVAQEVDTVIALVNDTSSVAQVPASVTMPAGHVSATVPVSALAPGNAQITASVNGTSATSSVYVTLPPPVVTALTPATLILPKGTPGTLQVSVSRAPNTATAIALSSSDPSIASVPPTVNISAGALTADLPVATNAVGQATITATLNGASVTSNVTVSAAELVTLTLSPQSPTAYIGETVPFIATATMTDGTTQDFTNNVTWSTSDTNIASISSSGAASALSVGQVTISASYSFTPVATGQSVTIVQSTPLTVKTPVNLGLSAPVTVLRVGESTTVTITSSDPASSQGLTVTLVASGAGNAGFSNTVQIPANGTSGSVSLTATAVGTLTLTASAFERLPGTMTFIILPADNGGVPPPDPATLAPPTDPTVPTQIAASTAFLYTGPDAIQTGVAPGTIDVKRAAVMRGKVLTRDNRPLPGVTIAVRGHPEFGQTVSRADGMFDMAANGGGYLTIDYIRPGYLPVQRTLMTPWQDYVMAPDVVMIRLDAQATAIDLTATTPMQVARGNVVTDQDGTRQATLLFAEGTTATMVLPNGTTQPLTSLTVRATEYTVGPNGSKAMPGPLPPTSGYTYAVELSIDETMAVGAKTIQFNQPVVQYVDNFLSFPVGTPVPAGYYDRDKAAWVPSPNGRVVKILSITNGAASLDIDGSNTAANDAALATLNITLAERAQLATLYAIGKSLWRVPITHFTPWDYNWPFGPSLDATPPTVPDPGIPPLDKPDCHSGSIIECQNQSLGESVPVTGTAFSLNYKSSRMPGSDSLSVPIVLSGATLPPGVKRIELVVNVAGRQFTQTFSATPNQSYTFVWDGLDAYGRQLQGAQPVSIRIGYVYGLVYLAPADFKQSFGNFGNGVLAANRAGMEVTLWQDRHTTLNSWHASAAGLGGWTLNVQHTYDANAQVLYLGDGRTRSAHILNNSITTVAGNGSNSFSGDGGPAIAAGLGNTYGLTGDAQGNLYIADTFNNRIRKVTPDGIITTIAGNGSYGFSGDGGPAAATMLSFPLGMAVDAQGNLYIADLGNVRVRKVIPAGIISTVAGSGSCCFSGDGGLATAAALNYIAAVAVDAQENLYILDREMGRVRKVTPDGIINTVVGNGQRDFSGDGGLATSAGLNLPMGIAVDTQGVLYIADTVNRRIRKVTPDGVITTVAGNGNLNLPGDGGLATEANIGYPTSVTVDAQGALYIGDGLSGQVRKVTSDGIITTVVGGPPGFSGDGGPAKAAGINSPFGLTVDGQGALYIADANNNRIRKVSPNLFPAVDGNDFIIASEDGTQLYHFDPTGRHLQTLNAGTGALQYSFTYATNGYLSQFTDGDGNVTRIVRDGAGNPSAIISPDGVQTTLTVDGNSLLTVIANPANERYRMTYDGGGLLTAFINPRNQASSITYDAAGKLIKDQNAAGGFWGLARAELSPASYRVSMTSALGSMTTYQTEHLSTGDTRLTNTQPNGSVSVILQKTDGSTQNTAADGTITTSIDGPDSRFGMQTPITNNATIRTPSGLTFTTTANRNVTLSNPKDLLSLITQTDTVTVNGNTTTSLYTAATRINTETSAVGRQIQTTTDMQDRPVQVNVAGLAPVAYTYDPRGRLTDITQTNGTDTRATHLNYNVQGWLANATDALGRSVGYQYDAAGRIIQQTLPDGRVILWNYDANGNITSITPPSRPSHAFAYTEIDQELSYTPPVLGTSTTTTQYAYDLDKHLTNITRPDGQTINFTYDTAGRLATLVMPNGTTAVSYNTSSGQLSTLTAPDGGTLSYSYDGLLPLAESWTGTVAGTVARTYNNDFRVASLNLQGVTVPYAYDADGLLTQAGDLAFTRDANNGIITGTTLGPVTTTQGFNGFGELTSINAALQSGLSVFSATYTRDLVGRITAKTEVINGLTDSYAYTYDLVGRLTDVAKNGANVSHYTYDDNGNRLSAGNITGTYDNQDRLTQYGGTTYTYTDNGELKTKSAGAQSTAYAYDVAGNLRSVTQPDGTLIEYVIDGRNRRIGTKINGTLVQGFLYENQLRPAAELDASGNVVSRFVYGAHINSPDYMVKSGINYRIVKDHLGSPRLIIDTTTGAIIQRIDYDEFGNVIADSNPGFQPFGFAGGLYDQHTQLTRFGARDYDAQAGRWTVKDPIRFAGGDTNIYAYVNGNPIGYLDPDGKDSITDWLKKLTGWLDDLCDINKQMQGVDDRYNAAMAANQPPPGKRVVDTDPATGLPYYLGQVDQYHKDLKANGAAGFEVAGDILKLAAPESPTQVGKALGKAATGKQF